MFSISGLFLHQNLVENNRYANPDEFFRDVNLIFSNCALFNGLNHPLTKVNAEPLKILFETKLFPEVKGFFTKLEGLHSSIQFAFLV